MKTLGQTFGIALVLAAAAFYATPCLGEDKIDQDPPPAAASKAQTPESLAAQWGVEVTAVRLSANGYLVDFRYKVLDPDKAVKLSDRHAKPYLLDPETGAKLVVPKSPKIGPLRQTAQKPEAGRVYFTLFANVGKVVKRGSKVTVAIGDCRVENLTVE